MWSLRKITELFYIIFFILSLQIWYEFYIYRTLPFGLATFQVLNRHMWLVATILNRVALESSGLPISAKDSRTHRGAQQRRAPSTPAELHCTFTCLPSSTALSGSSWKRYSRDTEWEVSQGKKKQKWGLLTNKKHEHSETSQTQCPNAFFCLQHQTYNKCHKRSKGESNF